MDLNLILKLCWTIIVVILTLILVFAFIETIVRKIQEPKRKKEQIQALDKFTEDFINAIKENKEDKPKAKATNRTTTRKTTKKKED